MRISLLPIYEECNTLGSSTYLYFLNTKAERDLGFFTQKPLLPIRHSFMSKKNCTQKNIKSLQRVSKFNVLQTLNSFKIFFYFFPLNAKVYYICKRIYFFSLRYSSTYTIVESAPKYINEVKCFGVT